MSEELKPCPFCGKDNPQKHITADAYCLICECGSYSVARSPAAAEGKWNTRPLEAAQAARIAELEAALRMIAENPPVERVPGASGIMAMLVNRPMIMSEIQALARKALEVGE